MVISSTKREGFSLTYKNITFYKCVIKYIHYTRNKGNTPNESLSNDFTIPDAPGYLHLL